MPRPDGGMCGDCPDTEETRMNRIEKIYHYMRGGCVPGGQPYRLTAGMAIGTRTRGNAAVARASTKARNVTRNRLAHR